MEVYYGLYDFVYGVFVFRVQVVECVCDFDCGILYCYQSLWGCLGFCCQFGCFVLAEPIYAEEGQSGETDCQEFLVVHILDFCDEVLGFSDD